ncbi:MAG: hypothetical protein WBO48_04175 [Candidatus Promineifilaceae bacterium]
MEYGIKFLRPFSENGQQAHLYVGQNRLSLVADFGTPWLRHGEPGKVRLARPSGEALASLEFPGLKTTSKGGVPRISYALIYDHAVYAIITQHTWPNLDDADAVSYFMIEAEGQRWAALNREVNGRSLPDQFVLCDNAPAVVEPHAQFLDDCQAAPVGQIQRPTSAEEYQVIMPDGRFRQPQLILLALVFLIHQLPG